MRNLLLAFAYCWTALAAPKVEGEAKVWHRIAVTFEGSALSEDANPNPFLDNRWTSSSLTPHSGRSTRSPATTQPTAVQPSHLPSPAASGAPTSRPTNPAHGPMLQGSGKARTSRWRTTPIQANPSLSTAPPASSRYCPLTSAVSTSAPRAAWTTSMAITFATLATASTSSRVARTVPKTSWPTLNLTERSTPMPPLTKAATTPANPSSTATRRTPETGNRATPSGRRPRAGISSAR